MLTYFVVLALIWAGIIFASAHHRAAAQSGQLGKVDLRPLIWIGIAGLVGGGALLIL